jgi:hypothetical protein
VEKFAWGIRKRVLKCIPHAIFYGFKGMQHKLYYRTVTNHLNNDKRLKREYVFYQFARKALAFRPGMDSADGVAVLEAQSGVRCCSMYWRTMEIGAPPQLDAK